MAPIKILLLSCLSNGVTEDKILTNYLRTSKFDVDHQDCRFAITNTNDLSNFNLILLRNVWPFEINKDALQHLADIVRSQNLKTYNPLRDNNFQEDKRYLFHLMQEGYPVIPTLIENQNRQSLGFCQNYIIKPLDASSSHGVEQLTPKALEGRDLSGYVIQPLIDFTHEVSFYFIDGQFIHALRTRSKVDFRDEHSRWDLEYWSPTDKQIEWAKQFVTWNSLPYGFERIDAGQLTDGNLMLMEIEDIAPFLSLDRLSKKVSETFLGQLSRSLLGAVELS